MDLRWTFLHVIVYGFCFDLLDAQVGFGEPCGIIDPKSFTGCESSEALSHKSDKRIVGGCASPSLPWFAQMLIHVKASETHKCGGAFINKFWMITAAHCFCNSRLTCTKNEKTGGGLHPVYNITQFHRILLPYENLEKWSQINADTLYPVEVVVHQQYDPVRLTMDFALVRLSYPIADNAYGIGFQENYSNDSVMPICLPQSIIFPDLEKHATVGGRGILFSNCFTNSKGPEAFRPCAKKWKIRSGRGEKLHTLRTGTNDKCVNSPRPINKLCRDFSGMLRHLGKTARSKMTEDERKIFSAFPTEPDEVILIEDKELASKSSGYDKVHCFSTVRNNWCGVCDPDAKEGEAGYCEEDGIARNIEHDSGWGFCHPSCTSALHKFTSQMNIAHLYTFNSSICVDMLIKKENKKLGIKESFFDPENEICAGFVTNISAPVIAYTKKGEKYDFKLVKVNHPELRTKRMKSSRFEADQLVGGNDACHGDSGGPLWVTEDVYTNRAKEKRAHLIGVVFRGVECANKDLPGIYGRVKMILPWIMSTASKPQKYEKKLISQGVRSVRAGSVREITPFWEDPPNRIIYKKKKLKKSKKKGRKKKAKKTKRKKKKKKKQRKKRSKKKKY